jgi:hypothetical protein
VTITTFVDLIPKIVSNSVAENSEPTFDIATTYQVDDVVQYEGNLWKSAKADNLGHVPTSDETYWAYVEPINKLKMFDDYPITQTVDTDTIVIEFKDIRNYSSIVFGNMYCEKIDIELKREDDTIFYTKTIDMFEIADVANWYRFFTSPLEFEQKTEHIETIQQTEISIKAKITVYPHLGDTKIGLIGFGSDKVFGCTVNNMNYNDNPDLTLQKINGTLKPIGGDTRWGEMSYSIFVEDRYVIKKELKKLNGKTVLFKGDDTGDDLIYSVLGFFMGFDIDIPNYTAY